MAQTINRVIFDIIKGAYIIKKRTEDEKDDYEEELKNELFNDYLHHYDADDIKMFKYMKIFKQLYHYYKDNFDMGDNVIDAIDSIHNKQKLFNLYALMVFGELIDDVVRDKTADKDEDEYDDDIIDEKNRLAREDDDVWG